MVSRSIKKRATPSPGPAPGWSDRPPKVALARELVSQSGKAAYQVLPRQLLARPRQVVAAIRAQVQKAQARHTPLRQPQRRALCLMLACLWGEQLRAELGWEWAEVKWPGGGGLGVVSPDRSLAVFPLPWLTGILEERRPPSELVRLFNRLADGKVPASAPGRYATPA